MRTGFIDWTEGQINLYVFDGEKPVETLYVPLEGDLHSSLLSSFLKAGAGQIYLSLPCSSLSLRELTFPFTDKTKIKDTISYELEGLLLGSVSDYAIDHIVTEAVAGGSKVLAACIEKTKLGEIINVFLSAGLEPKIITSIDIHLSGGIIEKLVEAAADHDMDMRIEAAREEVLNPSINLRQDELSYTGDIERMKKSLRITFSLILILMLILSAHTLLKFTAQKKMNRVLTDELQTVYRSVFPEDKRIVDAVKQFRGNLNILREKKSVLGGIPILDMLNEIADLKNRNVTIIEFNADGKNLIIKGNALSFEEVDVLKNSLSASFEGVKVISSDATADKKINFTLLMQEKHI